jgi:hypothetical protein
MAFRGFSTDLFRGIRVNVPGHLSGGISAVYFVMALS